MSDEHDIKHLMLLTVWLTARENAALRVEVDDLRRQRVRTEQESALRATTIANELVIRTHEAELDNKRLRNALMELTSKDLAPNTLRARLRALLADDD